MVMVHSADSVFQLNDGSSLRDLSPYILRVNGLPGAAELIDKTVLGDAGRTWFKGLENIVFTVDFLWSEDASVGPHTVLALVRALTAATAFDYGPEGKAGSDIKYSGTCFLKEWPNETRIGDLVRILGVQFQVQGVVSLGTY